MENAKKKPSKGHITDDESVLDNESELYSSYELSLRDLDEGRVYEVKDLNELMKLVED